MFYADQKLILQAYCTYPSRRTNDYFANTNEPDTGSKPVSNK